VLFLLAFEVDPELANGRASPSKAFVVARFERAPVSPLKPIDTAFIFRIMTSIIGLGA
jgi:hypothetical protein